MRLPEGFTRMAESCGLAESKRLALQTQPPRRCVAAVGIGDRLFYAKVSGQ
jgi:hypothetical protein